MRPPFSECEDGENAVDEVAGDNRDVDAEASRMVAGDDVDVVEDPSYDGEVSNIDSLEVVATDIIETEPIEDLYGGGGK